jgi:HTH-type transcriptional regulator / antitoxin HigA
MSTIKPIRDEGDYDRALRAIDRLMDAEAGTEEGDRLDVLTTLVEAYEARRWPIEAADPIDLLRMVMDQRGIRPRDLRAILGPRVNVPDILARRRPLTLPMARRLHERLGIPAEALLRSYRLAG